MACFSVGCSHGYFIARDNLGFYGGKTMTLGRYGGFFCSSFPFPSRGHYKFYKSQKGLLRKGKFRSLVSEKDGVSPLGFYSCCKSQSGLSFNNEIKPLRSGNNGDRPVYAVNRKNSDKVRRRLSLRLRPRLRLLTIKLRRLSVRSMLDDVGTFVRKNIRRVTFSAAISVALGLCYLFLKVTALPSPKMVPYSDLIMSLQNGSVTKVLIEEGSRRIYYNTNLQSVGNVQMSDKESSAMSAPSENVVDKVASDGSMSVQSPNVNVLKKISRTRASVPVWQYSARKIDHDEKFLLSLMREKGTTYSSAPQSVMMSIRSTLITVLTLWIPLIPLMWLLYRQLSAANSPARKRRPDNEIVGFDDVEGVDAAKVELMEIVSCLQGAINYQKLGAKLPRGVLLVGPPGTGKTLLARAVAGEAGVPFFTVSASEFVEMFVGRGAARIRDLFNVARKHAPSIIFIDELDAVGGKRGRSFNDERDQTLNQLLTEMDGFETDMKVVVIAATNRPEALDPALCRPGRFSRKVLVGEPDEEGRRKILAVHLRGVPLDEDMYLICDLVASLTPGFVGADLANIVNEAALLAARRGGDTVKREDVMEAIERAKFGINYKQFRPTTISKELGKLFPWMPSLMRKNEAGEEGLQGPLGYQTLS
ncbi:probable inactive ATP-dependent zinc metalloprotease FTSHI 3, chloroplastic [Ziziphus jujuba]|uniref:Probable inactive ATP-dependent zinc metalloprotease FTSHI 3, chloroplastic n=1 Tax=Ziziphus jujuba TaxID=326968 RepID=A0A6P3ZNE2_ZIZJJ|nr:probable inactive ATP-dependent zinc metalloprotease FTSHI 3, chloroplastic [Ziziphus jujuba]